MRISKAQARELGIPVDSTPKYRNQKTVVDGITFDSKKEARRWTTLRLMEQGGLISSLSRQVTYSLIVNGEIICSYQADFCYIKDGKLVIEDVKSAATRKTKDYRIKSKLLHALHGITIQEV